MDKEAILLAKVAALKKNFDEIEYSHNRCLGIIVNPLFPRYKSVINDLLRENPNLYGDIPDTKIPESIGISANGPLYEKHQILPLIQNLSYIMELSSNVRIGEKAEEKEKKNRIFITHGRSNEWHKIQNYLEKDLGIDTIELAQEPNLGRSVIQKLQEEGDKCSIATIVMTGDDLTTEGEVRARENVMHEIGYFQGRFGLKNVILLHEHGVNIPSNINGLVYIGFPKDTAEAALGALTRELKVLIPS